MIRRLPVVATLVVLAAVGIMIRLGFWQLDRMKQKEAMIAQMEQFHPEADVEIGPWLMLPSQGTNYVKQIIFRRGFVRCDHPSAITARSGRNRSGEAGWAIVANCPIAGAQPLPVTIGWSKEPDIPVFKGAIIHGIIAPGPRLIADPPVAGLMANARPDTVDIPNNHFAYAVQWFLFAGVALVIYALAVRKRLQGK